MKPSLVEWKHEDGSLAVWLSSSLKPSLVEWKQYCSVSDTNHHLPLKPSLVEWKRSTPRPIGSRQLFLETFLSGMETPCSGVSRAAGRYPLKPSLVEWKRFPTLEMVPPRSALKPSLVEWKLDLKPPLADSRRHLETFLSGMETPTGLSALPG